MPPHTVSELLALVAHGRVKYLHFWGHRPERDGSIGRGCLSQWFDLPFDVEGRTFHTAEHYMMWRKALLFNDVETADRVVAAGHPHRAKALGREVRGFDQVTWERERYAIVVAGSVAKFGYHDKLATYLDSTGDRILVEASPMDRIWGIGLAADDPRANDPSQWRGENLLGFALMSARSTLRSGSAVV